MDGRPLLRMLGKAIIGLKSTAIVSGTASVLAGMLYKKIPQHECKLAEQHKGDGAGWACIWGVLTPAPLLDPYLLDKVYMLCN